jgi:hypothetical protein
MGTINDYPRGPVANDERHRRQERTMSDAERVETIAKLRRRGRTWEQCGRAVGLSANGAKYALHKVTQPGRYAEVYEEEVDPA